jgi:prepilin-type N-terminal cleavage/methylation domain-containing protein
MLKKMKNNNKGFTIIEVLIVLAIAGLILLIVFLAVPSLQRASRNTQRKNDVSAIAAAVSNYINNNGGTLPNHATFSTNTSTDIAVIGCSGTTPPTGCAPGNTESAKLGFYTESSANPNHIKFLAAFTSGATTSDINTVTIDDGYGCNSTNTAAGSVPNSRTAAILYQTENGNGTVIGTNECVEQ